MSMWLTLRKIDTALLEAIRDRPELVHELFFEVDDAAPPRGFRPWADAYGYDYRTISAIVEGRAEDEEGTTDWTGCYPWMARAIGHEGGEVIEDYEFCYGPAFVLTPDEVKKVAKGLAAEGWGLGASAADWGDDRRDDDDEFEDLGSFFAAAAAEGRAVIGGVS